MKKISVDEHLDNIDYTSQYSPTVSSVYFTNFIKLVEDGEPENKTPVVHLRILDSIFTRHQSTAIMSHRGIAKSTLMEYILWHCAVFGYIPDGVGKFKVDFALYISDAIDNGVKTMRKSIDSRFERSNFLRKHIKEIKTTETRLEFTRINGTKFIVRMYGAATGVRGARELGQRPTLAILDDLVQKEELARSKPFIESINSTVYSDVEDAMHPTKRKVIWLGTPFNQGDPLYEAIESGAWKTSVYPIAERFPCTREEFKGSWEERFTYDAVMTTYKKRLAAGLVDKFYRELMLKVSSEDEQVLDVNDIIEVSELDISSCNIYITTDFATSEKEKADYSVISVWALTQDKEYVLIDGICKRQLMDANVEDLMEFIARYRPFGVSIERSGAQKGFIEWIKGKMIERGLYTQILGNIGSNQEGVYPSKDKLSRFMEVVPLFRSGKVKYLSSLDSSYKSELLNELKNVTISGIKSKHDDVLDTISMLILSELIFPDSGGNYSEDQTVHRYDEIGIESNNELISLFED